jgi:hypothetical protein
MGYFHLTAGTLGRDGGIGLQTECIDGLLIDPTATAAGIEYKVQV